MKYRIYLYTYTYTWICCLSTQNPPKHLSLSELRQESYHHRQAQTYLALLCVGDQSADSTLSCLLFLRHAGILLPQKLSTRMKKEFILVGKLITLKTAKYLLLGKYKIDLTIIPHNFTLFYFCHNICFYLMYTYICVCICVTCD